MKLTERDLRNIIKESLKELDWKTYASAADKANKWRGEHPFLYDRNRGLEFDRAAQDAFLKQHDITNEPNYGGERGNINFTSIHGKPEISGSRNHNFGDDGGPFNLNHNVYHMGKQYGKNGGYGRTRMWDYAHETTPEEFYDDEEMGKKFRDAEQEVDNYKSGKYVYDNEKGWHLNENSIRQIVRESLKRIFKENAEYANMDDFSKMEQDLNEYGVKVNRAESDDKHIILMFPKEVSVSDRQNIGKYMRDWWHCHFNELVQNGDYFVLTFNRDTNEVTVADFEEFDNSEIADLFEKLLGVSRVHSQEEWNGLLETLAREIRKRGMTIEQVREILSNRQNEVHLNEKELRNLVKDVLLNEQKTLLQESYHGVYTEGYFDVYEEAYETVDELPELYNVIIGDNLNLNGVDTENADEVIDYYINKIYTPTLLNVAKENSMFVTSTDIKIKLLGNCWTWPGSREEPPEYEVEADENNYDEWVDLFNNVIAKSAQYGKSFSMVGEILKEKFVQKLNELRESDDWRDDDEY